MHEVLIEEERLNTQGGRGGGSSAMAITLGPLETTLKLGLFLGWTRCQKLLLTDKPLTDVVAADDYH